MLKLDVAQSLYESLDTENNPFNVACTLFAGRLVRDRFSSLHQYSTYNWIDAKDPVPEIVTTPIAELIDQRAQDFVNHSVTVQWSGGVDSTTILLALIKNGIHKDDLQICYDIATLSEYPKLYLWLKDNHYNLKQVDKWRKYLGHVDTDLITNGWCADQLFGSIFFHDLPGQYFTPIKEFLFDFSYPFGKLSEQEAEEYAHIYKESAKEGLGIDLNIAAELGWYINFSLKWTWVSTFNTLFLLNTPNMFKTKCFFNTPYFQGWSLGNFNNIATNNIYGKKARFYKKELKEYCYTVFPDGDYLNNKTKFPSWNSALSNAKDNIRIAVKDNEGYSAITFNAQQGEFTDMIARFFTKYKK